MVAGRGYRLGSSSKDSFEIHRGGVAVSYDGGKSWQHRSLPRDEQWVENLVIGPDGAVYCWATKMVFDFDHGSRWAPAPMYGTARLYRSTDLGNSWHLLFTDDYATDTSPRAAVDHQWSISFSPSGAIAISTPLSVFVAAAVGEEFTPVEELPFGATIGGAAFGQEGTLWVAGSHGIHKRSVTTSVKPPDSFTNNLLTSIAAQPNPAFDKVILRISTGGVSASLPDYLMLTSLDGVQRYRIARNGDKYIATSADVCSGAYVASANLDGKIVTTLVFVVR